MILCPVKAPCRVTQHFGDNYKIYRQFGLAGHNGIDFTGEHKGEHVPVYSPFDAQVVVVGDEGKKGYGKYVRLHTKPDNTGRKRDIVLAHLSESFVEVGDWVPMGDPVGVMGNTGFSSGLHLHLGLRYLNEAGNVLNANNGYFGYVDFEPYLRFWVEKREFPDIVEYPYG